MHLHNIKLKLIKETYIITQNRTQKWGIVKKLFKNIKMIKNIYFITVDQDNYNLYKVNLIIKRVLINNKRRYINGSKTLRWEKPHLIKKLIKLSLNQESINFLKHNTFFHTNNHQQK